MTHLNRVSFPPKKTGQGMEMHGSTFLFGYISAKKKFYQQNLCWHTIQLVMLPCGTVAVHCGRPALLPRDCGILVPSFHKSVPLWFILFHTTFNLSPCSLLGIWILHRLLEFSWLSILCCVVELQLQPFQLTVSQWKLRTCRWYI